MSRRDEIGLQLQGRVLEIGPGHQPFPVHPQADVVYADRPVRGGRDENFPELVGTPHGPTADVELDLDVEGLRRFADQSFDSVVVSHVLEHLAAPIAAIQECLRILRPGGLLLVALPERTATFDQNREGTTFDHLWREHLSGVRDVDKEHIVDYCRSVFLSPPVHPPQVRAWHDPDRLDDELLALHRRRSIHAHCWRAEEFAATLAALEYMNAITVELVTVQLAEDDPERFFEFTFVLRKPIEPPPGAEGADRFIADFVTELAAGGNRSPKRLAAFATVVVRDLGPLTRDSPDHLVAWIDRITGALAQRTIHANGQVRRLQRAARPAVQS